MPTPAPAEAPAETAAPEPAPAATGTVDLVCQFSDAWVSVVPRRIYRPNDNQLMQALIGFANDPNTWGGQPAWARYAPYAARTCGVDPIHVSLPPGSYVVLVAKLARPAEAAAEPAEGGEVEEGPEESEGDEVAAQAPPNGRIERFSVRAGETVSKTFQVGQLNRAWPGI